ncbi:glutaredoxin family protein [Cellvibrio mixtus]|uniref:glutaredoxin family protein n=1 Tax=Cellvibrio mixtus TaxID=39650 RepID=UPI000586DC1C|nr:glutaredoxin family protein [Cellvibrio mixtus]
MKTVYLYSTAGCHLCDLAWDILAPLISNLPLRLEEVDIAESDELIERYGVRIPVLKFNDFEEELGWPFDTTQASIFLQKFSYE